MGQRKRNHFVPRWLLRRFACPDSKSRDQIWMLRAGSELLRTSINNAGSGNYFYGDPTNGLEDLLAKIDNRDSRLLATIERTSDLRPHGDAICRMVRLLSVRTRALREKFTNAAVDMFEVLEERARDPASEAAMRARVASTFDVEFDKAWDKLPPHVRLQTPKTDARALARAHAEQTDLRAELSHLFAAVKNTIPWKDSAERGHVKGLLELLQRTEAEPIPEGWRRLAWSLEKLPSPSLVLADCVALAVRGDKPGFRMGADAGEEPRALCLPIAPDTLLVGVVPAQAFPTGAAEINRASVAHSYDSFFSSRISDAILALVPHLGEVRGVLPRGEIDEIGRAAWRDLNRD